jgi:5-methylcytosine-specific restriction endonuclease McrA
MRQDEHETLRRIYQFRCGYCGVRERDAGAELTVDHFQPRSQGGLDGPENWVYSCHACNEFKGQVQARLLESLRQLEVQVQTIITELAQMQRDDL